MNGQIRELDGDKEGGRKVRLNWMEVMTATKMGIPLEELARMKALKEEREERENDSK